MFWDIFKVLLPTMFVHLIVSVGVAAGVWYLINRIQKTWAVRVYTFMVVAAGWSVWHSAATMIELKENEKLRTFVQTSQQSAQQVAAQNLTVGQPEELKVRQSFLNVLSQFLANPQQMTPENKQQVLNNFAAVYGNEKVAQFYNSNLSNFFICSRAYVQDTIDSITNKKEVTSDVRKQCQNLSGEFFNRPKLLEDAFTQSYTDFIAMAVGRKPASKSKKDLPTLEALKADLQRQEVGYQVVTFLFQK